MFGLFGKKRENNHLLVIGGPTHGDGQLVVSIEPQYQSD